LLLVLLLLLSPWTALGQAPGEDEDQEAPGLIAEFGPTGVEPVVVRIEPDLAYDWAAGAPDARVPADGFSGRWSGLLLIQAPGSHRFHARTEGEVRMTLGGRAVLEGQGRFLKTTPAELPAGFAPVTVEYRHTRGLARLAIDWEGPAFAREPLPARLLFHKPGQSVKAAHADRFEEGRRLADRLGCANCHALLDLPRHVELGPPLEDAGWAIEPAWVAGWLTNPAALRSSPRMPAFGSGLSPGEVADLVAWLRQVASNPKRPTNEVKMAMNVAEPTRGRLLFRSVGCLGCHSRGGSLANTHDRAAPDLADLGRKRTPAWLATFLAHPKGNTPSPHRPDLSLTSDEGAHLASYLVSDPPPPWTFPELLEGDPASGRALAQRLRCASCHTIPQSKSRPADLELHSGSNPKRGCLADDPIAGVPRFAITAEQREALRSLVAGIPREPSPTPPQTLAGDTIRRLNCLGCHTRDSQGGKWVGTQVADALATDPALSALKGTLTPPNLSAVGDKLRADYLSLAVRGRAATARPWLSVRMPAFPFASGEADSITHYLRQHDRIDPEGVAEPPDVATHPDARSIDHATSLIGQRGFGCISCHVLAGKIPPGGEPETLGPDLALARRRMTEHYFHRWIANPQRIIPGTPMPQFLKPLPDPPGSLDDQLATIWQLLGSPRLDELVAFSTRERLKPQGDRALVVRDMVVLPDGPGSPYNPRGLAIGLKNGHSLLFDTDRLAWVAWWQGGFMYRTKSGRLWEWHPEGKMLWLAPDRAAPLVFIGPGGAITLPSEERERFGHFGDLVFDGEAVSFSYILKGPGRTPVTVTERITPSASGVERTVLVTGTPRGFQPALAVQPPPSARPVEDGVGLSWASGPCRVTVLAQNGGPAPHAASASSTRLFPMKASNLGSFALRLTLSAEPSSPVPPP
jgi:mono/diheme cytochrome c family protein